MPRLEHTSVPLWAAGGGVLAEPDRSGTTYLLVGFGPEGSEAVADWEAELASYDVRTLLDDDPASLAAELSKELAATRVGVRVRVAGPVGPCLSLRGTAVSAGVEDDELYVRPTGAGPIELWCVHCSETTTSAASIDDVAPCAGCGRRLLVHHHVSRRTGRFLGFQIDAEDPAEAVAS